MDSNKSLFGGTLPIDSEDVHGNNENQLLPETSSNENARVKNVKIDGTRDEPKENQPKTKQGEKSKRKGRQMSEKPEKKPSVGIRSTDSMNRAGAKENLLLPETSSNENARVKNVKIDGTPEQPKEKRPKTKQGEKSKMKHSQVQKEKPDEKPSTTESTDPAKRAGAKELEKKNKPTAVVKPYSITLGTHTVVFA